MVRELRRAAKKFAGLKASDAISKGKRGARLPTGWVGTLMSCDSHKSTLDGNGSGLADATHLRNGAWLCQISEETLRNGAWQPDPCFLNA